MKRFLTLLICALAAKFAFAQEISNLDITVKVFADGSAHFTHVWDATVSSGTEFYIPVRNLGKMSVSNLQVSENGKRYFSEGNDWKVKRSIDEKAWRCGIVDKGDGVELCWGQGSMGRHIWTAEFDATNLVQGYDDYDGFNFMFVNPDIGNIQNACVTIENATDGEEWTGENVKVWAFGFKGNIEVKDGKILCTTSEKMSKSHKIIILARFDKDLVQPHVSNGKSFASLQDKALKGSDYYDDDDDSGLDILALILVIIPILTAFFVGIWYTWAKITGRTLSKKIYGTKKVTGWWREPPQEGNLFASYYTEYVSACFSM